MVVRVHPSNFRIIGFTAAPSRKELAALASEKNLIFYEDLGSGALVDLTEYGLGDEPVVSHAIDEGADLVSFSGDKLLGGPQAGIVAGRTALIDRVRKHPLYRVLRPDKLTYASLEATLGSYRRGELDEVPVLKKLSMSADDIGKRAAVFIEALRPLVRLNVEIVDGRSAVGGGAAPTVQLPTRLIAIRQTDLGPGRVERSLRMNEIPIITRIENDRVLLDLRTVDPEDEVIVIDALRVMDR
jgi:L-seryl-tRNA(Ser) seleniumtransferase